MSNFVIGIVGATGLVGQALLTTIPMQVKDSLFSLKLFASPESIGKEFYWHQHTLKILSLSLQELQSCSLVIFAGDGASASDLIPLLAARGIPCIDKTGVFRMDRRVHLSIPSLNGLDEEKYAAFPVVASPNCCVVPLALVLFPLEQNYGLKRLIISTYQSLSGGGRQVLDQAINEQNSGLSPQLSPYIGSIVNQEGDTDEEWKIRAELRKILHTPELPVSVTSVRVPSVIGHGISVTVFLKNACLHRSDFDFLFHHSKQVKLLHEHTGNTSQEFFGASTRGIEGSCDVCVARVRSQQSDGMVWSFWLMSDNLVTGAAYNARKILESIIHANF